MANHNERGWKRVIYAFGFSMQGFKACFQAEEAFRQELFLLLFLVPLGLWLGATPVERALLIGCLLMVLVVELLNSAIEANVDRVGLERHDLSARAKDIASAAVFMSMTLTVVTWGLILIPKWL
ncbi:diacylglycerol kinase [Candidatus Thiodictyon syntrophicum]|jgi:diacylglycerol kinase (ATP)|uniref:Diacylglycerol kinase n=1 Tax=Candidatus Thiodictyon syntrophicum TaxID=1166950 RepID=A0A2K8UCN6_9GAMM|nr:diacylglycerol kinase [Candidatus Thiodictyon syntrophicum]AUB83362.1 diacylglycerol kinase [Candidatus Thiodictyon syntrophicum]